MSASLPDVKATGRARLLPVLVLVALVLAAARGLMPSDSGRAIDVVEPAVRHAGPSSSPVPQRAEAPAVPAAVPAVPPPGQAQAEPANSRLGPGEASTSNPRFDLGQGGALFGQKSAPSPAPKRAPEPAAPPPAPAIVTPPAPVRPAFSVIGTFQPRGEPVSLWINQGGQLTLARLGDVIDAHWRIEAIERTRVRLIHTSLATPAELPLPAELAR
jgi:hypothetical protein